MLNTSLFQNGLQPDESALFERVATRILDRLERELSPDLTYHNAAHTRYVLEKTVLLAEIEKITGKKRLLLYFASLFHDAGFLVSNHRHEAYSCEIARSELLNEGLTEEDLDTICHTIMATAIPQKPHSKAGRIIADADLFYMGTDQYDFYAEKLYEEICHFQPTFSRSEWLHMQIGFLQNHRYHTAYAKNNLEEKKRMHLERLLSGID